MSLTYGYDLKEGDDMMAAPVQVIDLMAPLLLPGGALVNNFLFYAVAFVTITMLAPHSYFQ